MKKILILSAYLFFVPSLYIILTEKRDDRDCAYHAAQAFILWILFLLIYTILVPIRDSRLAILLLWVTISFIGTAKIKVPVVSGLAEALC